jgi:mutator family transposase
VEIRRPGWCGRGGVGGGGHRTYRRRWRCETSTLTGRGTDDRERLALSELVEKAGDSDFLRTVAEAVLQLLMEAAVEGLIGAGRYERSGERSTWRNG